MTERLTHPFPPLYDENSKILILGSFPSVKSRQAMFFYGHPQNRFWRVVSELLGCEVPQSIEEKSAMLHSHHIALWDTIQSCDIVGSSDSSIRNAVPNDLAPILQTAQIRQIFCNGSTSFDLYRRYAQPLTGRPAEKLPSTSPANAAWTLPRLLEAWKTICRYL